MVPSPRRITLHFAPKNKFPHEGKIMTITAETKVVVAISKLAPKEISVSPGFKICMIYEDELNPKISSMIKGMNFMLEMGLENNQ